MRQSRKRYGLRAACAGAAMATVWSGAAVDQAQAVSAIVGTPMTVKTNLTSAVSNAYLLYGLNTSGLTSVNAYALGDLPAEPFSVDVSLFGWELSEWNLPYLRWTIVGSVGTEEVSVAMDSVDAAYHIGEGHDWLDVFSSSYDEATTWGFIDSGDTYSLTNWFYSNHYNTNLELGETGTQVNFSVAGGNGGAQLVLAVPEPASIGLLAIGGLTLLARKRRA